MQYKTDRVSTPCECGTLPVFCYAHRLFFRVIFVFTCSWYLMGYLSWVRNGLAKRFFIISILWDFAVRQNTMRAKKQPKAAFHTMDTDTAVGQNFNVFVTSLIFIILSPLNPWNSNRQNSRKQDKQSITIKIFNLWLSPNWCVLPACSAGCRFIRTDSRGSPLRGLPLLKNSPPDCFSIHPLFRLVG